MTALAALPRTASLCALLEHLVDYAGLFPPAALDMEATARNFGAALAGPESWLVERLVVPAGRLEELERFAGPLLPRGEEDEPWAISALLRAGDDPGLAEDLDRVAAFNARHAAAAPGRAVIDVVEIKAPTPAAIDAALDAMPDDLFPFFEIPVDRDPRGLVATLVGGEAGAKIRTGGLAPELYPDPAHVARFLLACAGADVPFKATAGMHHPLRGRNESVGCDEFGFLTFFLAAAFALHREPDAATLAALLVERGLDGIVIEPDRIAWRDLAATAEEIEDARLSFAVSFGCCSIAEPWGDLDALGLLAPES